MRIGPADFRCTPDCKVSGDRQLELGTRQFTQLRAQHGQQGTLDFVGIAERAHADDVYASKSFYEKVLGWQFRPWAPPGFFQIDTGEGAPNVQGALQQRRELIEGQRTVGFECTFAVDDVDAIARAVRAAGGVILMERFTIAGVGHLIFFADPAGYAVGAMQYDADAQ